MTRLIPGKTKVNIELFRGVTVWDVLIAAAALAMDIFVFFSNLPMRFLIAVIVLSIGGFLILRIDGQPNYLFVIHLLSFLGFRRHFARHESDETLRRIAKEGEKSVAFDEVFGEGEEKEPRKKDTNQKKLTREEKAAAKKAKKEARKAGKKGEQAAGEAFEEKARKDLRKKEDKLLKSKDVSEEEKQRILERRLAEDRELAAKAAERREAATDRLPMEEIIAFTGIKNGFIEYLDKSYYGAVLEIDPVEFRFFSNFRRINSIENCLGRILRSLNPSYCANIVKLERPIDYDSFLAREYDKLDRLKASYENGVLTEDELKARVEVEYDRINELWDYCRDHRVVTQFYYLVLFDSDKRQLTNEIRDAVQLLQNGEMTVHRLDDRELAQFLKYSNQIDFDEKEIDEIRPEDYHIWAMPDIVDIHARNVEVNHIITHNFRVVTYPTTVNDSWLAGVMSLPGTKVVVKARPMDRGKAIKNIDHSLQELRAQWSATGVDSKRIEIETHVTTLEELLGTLQSDSESLLEVNIYITAYDIVATRKDPSIIQPPLSELPSVTEMKKNTRRAWQESGLKLNNLEFDQVQAFIGSQVNGYDPLASDGRGIPSNTVAASFPWIFAHISDEGGVKLGESDGVPVFIDFFRRDSERVNSNMVIVGKSGSGKSYATKSLLTNLSAEEAKIFILDPENEYTDLAANLHGQIINVGNAQHGRLNPFQIITALDDDEGEEDSTGNSYATHLQFLEEFFKQIMPDCGKDAMEYLNTLVDHMYLEHDITAETNLADLSPEDYPIFDDLYDEVLQEFQSSDNPFTRDLLRTLMNYIAKFSTGGRNANIWNGPSTITTEENFTVFNFQSMLANRNGTISNAQMLLVLKYIDNEIIKNREYNTKYKANRKIIVVIDEAHVFIDAKFPVALDFMFQLAKRIRKYNGMQIVITQNIKDFVGSEELARKSTAIINACQYSFIFSLAPNDMQDLVMLYEKAGGINETEQEQIVQAPRGQAFVIMGPTSRSSFTVETAPGIAKLFEEPNYTSRYFTGEQGEKNWEEFIGESRGKRVEAKPSQVLGQSERKRAAASRAGKNVLLRVFDEDEIEQLSDDTGETSGSTVLLTENEENPSADRKVLLNVSDAAEEKTAAVSAPEILPEVAATGTQAMDVFGLIANALGRMADAAERGRTSAQAVPEIAPETTKQPEAPLSADAEKLLMEKEEEIQRLQREKDEVIRRLMEENERMRAGSPEQNIETPEADETDSDLFPDEDLEEETGPFDGLDPDEFGDEEDGDLLDLFGGYDDEDDREEEEEEDYDFLYDDFDEDDEDDEDEEAVPGSDEDEEEDEEEDDEDDEDEDDFMSSFCQFAQSLHSMGVFERMKMDGTQVRELTVEDLINEVKIQTENRRNRR